MTGSHYLTWYSEDTSATWHPQPPPPTRVYRANIAEPDPPLALIDLPEVPAWMADAACIGCPEAWFFPERGDQARQGKRVCAGCPVATECCDYALSFESTRGHPCHGVFGGLTALQRQVLTGRRAKGEAA